MPKVKLNDVRLSFPDLFEAKKFEGKADSVPRYSATFLIEKGSDNHKKIIEAIKAAAAIKWEKKADAIIESLKGNSNKFCYQNGDTKEYDGYQGMMFIAAHRKESDGRPLVLDRNKAPLQSSDGKPYGGCYVNASVDIYAQEGKYPGIRCGLIAVQFNRNGDSFGGASRSTGDEFDDLGNGVDSDFDGGNAVDDFA